MSDVCMASEYFDLLWNWSGQVSNSLYKLQEGWKLQPGGVKMTVTFANGDDSV